MNQQLPGVQSFVNNFVIPIGRTVKGAFRPGRKAPVPRSKGKRRTA